MSLCPFWDKDFFVSICFSNSCMAEIGVDKRDGRQENKYVGLKRKVASASGPLASVLDGLGPVRTGPRGDLPPIFTQFPFSSNPKFAERRTLYSTRFMAYCPSSRAKIAWRRGTIALPGAPGAHRPAPRISGCDDQPTGAALARSGPVDRCFSRTHRPLSPNCRTGTCLGRGCRAHFW